MGRPTSLSHRTNIEYAYIYIHTHRAHKHLNENAFMYTCIQFYMYRTYLYSDENDRAITLLVPLGVNQGNLVSTISKPYS